jgi:hypothetical protein
MITDIAADSEKKKEGTTTREKKKNKKRRTVEVFLVSYNKAISFLCCSPSFWMRTGLIDMMNDIILIWQYCLMRRPSVCFPALPSRSTADDRVSLSPLLLLLLLSSSF